MRLLVAFVTMSALDGRVQPKPSLLDWLLLLLWIAAAPLLLIFEGLPMPKRLSNWAKRFEPSSKGHFTPLRIAMGIAVVAWIVGGYLWLNVATG